VSADELEEHIQAVKRAGGHLGTMRQMLEVSLNEERLDLAEWFFKTLHIYPDHYRSKAIEVPDGNFKDRLTMMMLRTDSIYWPPEIKKNPGGVDPEGSPRPYEDYLEEPFLSTVAKYFPNMTLTGEIMNSKKERLRLAADIENAMQVGNPETPQRPDKRPEAASDGSKVGSSASSGGDIASIAKKESAVGGSSWVILFWLLPISFAGCLTVWLLRKNRV